MIDRTVILYIIFVLFILFIGIGIIIKKYLTCKNISLKKAIANSHIFTKITWFMLIILIASVQVVAVYSFTKQDSIPYSSGSIHDTLIVEDGVIVVGRTTAEVVEGHSSQIGGRAYIAKYDNHGQLMHETVYLQPEYAECQVAFFYNITEKDGYYIASNEGDCAVRFNESLEVVDVFKEVVETNIIQLINGELRYETIYNKESYTYTTKFTISDEIYEYSYRPGRNYQGDIGVYVLEETESSYIMSVILGEMLTSYYQYPGYNYVLELNKDDSSVSLLFETDEYRFRETLQIGSKEYVLSNNLYTRTTLLLDVDENYNILNETHIIGDKDYFVMKDWFIEDGYFYVIGNEYETMSKEGFTEYFSGIINVYDLNMKYVKTMRLPLGVQVISVEKQDNLIYIGGRYNTTIAASFLSGKRHYPWCGVYMVYDYKNEETMSYSYIDKQYINLD